jgi:hypothetical protein
MSYVSRHNHVNSTPPDRLAEGVAALLLLLLLLLRAARADRSAASGPHTMHHLLLLSASGFLVPTERRIGLKDIASEAQAIAGVRGVAALCSRWGEAEFRLLKTPPMEFSARRLDSGVALQFYSKQGQGQALAPDGSLELTLQPKGGSGNDADVVVCCKGRAADASARGRQLDLCYRLLLDDARAGVLGGQVALGLHPPTADVARLRKKIAAACLYNKEGQYGRF